MGSKQEQIEPKKKKVLFVATVDSHILHFHIPYLKMFHDKGWEVHVATNGKEKIPYCDKKHTLPMERSPFSIKNLKAIKQMRKLVKDEHFDIIHCHTPMGSVVTRLAAKKARKSGTRVIYTAHGFHFYKGAPLLNWVLFYPVEKYLAKYTDTLITINQEDYNRAKRKFSRRCWDIQYVPGVGVDPKKFDFKMSKEEKHNLRKSIGLKDDDYVLIFPAELSKRKNQIWLIKTLKPLFGQHPEIHLILPGKDSLNGKCQRLIKKLRIESQVHILGYRKDIPQLLKISNMAISSAKQEGLPVNLLEAATINLPIVATDCRGNRDIVDDAIRINNSEAFTNLVKEKMQRKSLKCHFLPVYKIESIKKRMEAIYNFDDNLKTIAIVTSGYLPVPAVKGGASEILLDSFIKQNEEHNNAKLVVFSLYDKKACQIGASQTKTTYVFIKPSHTSKALDKTIFTVLDKVLRYKGARKFRYFIQRINFTKKCGKYLHRFNYDIVLLENHTLLYNSLRYRKNYKKYAGRYYYHCHNVVPSKFFMGEIIRGTQKLISVSAFRNEYAKEYFNLPEEKCAVVYNCCNSEIQKIPKNSDIKQAKKQFGIEDDNRIVLFVGRIDKDKGALELIRAFNAASISNCKLIIAGAPIFGDKTKTEYEKIVKQEISNNPENIIFTGYIDHSKLNTVYSIADIVVVPSMVEDSAPLVILESLAQGKAIIASKCGGIPEYTNKKCAILIEHGDNYIDKLKTTLVELCGNPHKIKSMSTESKKRSTKYSEKEYYDKLMMELCQ